MNKQPVEMKSWHFKSSHWQSCGGVPLADRGFRYGMSVFESVAIVQGRPLLWSEHVERLARAARDYGAELGGGVDFDFSSLGTGMLRLYLTAGPGGPTDAFAGDMYAIFSTAEVGWCLPGLRVLISSAPYLPRPGGWKTGNYWQNVEALAHAQRAGCDEAFIFNPAGMLVSAAMGNVFLRIGGRWLTPSLETGARDGVVRKWLMNHLAVEESILDSSALAECEAAFVTNSRTGVRAVAELDGRPLDLVPAGPFQEMYFRDVYAA